jgi:hypothetical protein
MRLPVQLIKLEILMKKYLILSCVCVLFLSRPALSGGSDYALTFDGMSSYVDVPYSTTLQPSTTFTAEAWINIDPSAETDQKVLMTLGGWARGYAMNIYNDGGGFYFTAGIYLNGNNYFAGSNSQFIPANTWTHVAMTWSQAGGLKSYINGSQTASTTTAGNSYAESSNDITIGIGFTNIYYAPFMGKIDEVRLWSTVRSQAQLWNGMHIALTGSEPGLVAYYSMNDPDESTLFDNQLNGLTNDATIYFATKTLSAAPMPVELVSFTAAAERGQVCLRWKTASEVNNYGFEIEHRSNGVWQKIGFVEGHGTTNAPQSYSYADNAAKGQQAYRLKQVDRDGKYEYSKAVEVLATGVITQLELSQNYPNPFNPTTNISFTVPSTGRATLKILNILGQEVVTLFDGEAQAGMFTEVQFNASGLASGMYFSRLEYNGKVQTTKMTLMK